MTIRLNSLRRIYRQIRVALTPVPRPEKWVFVVGCYNSGTTLLADLLGRHSAVSALPTEGQFLTNELVCDYEVGLPRMWIAREDLFRMTENDAGPNVARIKKEWGMRLDLSRPVLLEKSPPNSARVRWLQAHFENSYFVMIVRDGYAVAEGIRRKAEPRRLPEGWPIQMAARQWRRSNELLLEDAEYLEKKLWVKYEDLTGDPAAELQDIFSFLGLPWEPGVLDGQPLEVHERRSRIRNLNGESVARLSPEELSEITAECADILVRFNYELRVPGED